MLHDLAIAGWLCCGQGSGWPASVVRCKDSIAIISGCSQPSTCHGNCCSRVFWIRGALSCKPSINNSREGAVAILCTSECVIACLECLISFLDCVRGFSAAQNLTNTNMDSINAHTIADCWAQSMPSSTAGHRSIIACS